MVTVIARETFPYAGVTRYKGNSFEATAEDARILGLMGRVEVKSAPVHLETPASDDEPEERPRRTYRRKDLTAEAPTE